MRKPVPLIAALLFVAFGAAAQGETTKLKIHVVLIDKDLNLKPVPKFALTVRGAGALRPVPGSPFLATPGNPGGSPSPVSVTVDPSGEFLYVTDTTDPVPGAIGSDVPWSADREPFPKGEDS